MIIINLWGVIYKFILSNITKTQKNNFCYLFPEGTYMAQIFTCIGIFQHMCCCIFRNLHLRKNFASVCNLFFENHIQRFKFFGASEIKIQRFKCPDYIIRIINMLINIYIVIPYFKFALLTCLLTSISSYLISKIFSASTFSIGFIFSKTRSSSRFT